MHFFRARQGNSRREYIETASLNSGEQAAVGSNQGAQRSAAIGINPLDERRAFFIQPPSAVRLVLQHFTKLRRQRPAQVFGAAVKTLEVFLRDIDAAHFEITAHVANNVRQLEGKTHSLRQVGRFGSRKPKTCRHVRPTVPATR